MAVLVVIQRKSFKVQKGLRRWQLAVGILISLQSIFLYSAIARIPVAIALLLINLWPVIFFLLNWVLRNKRPSLRVMIAITIILIGLVLVLDVASWFNRAEPMSEDWITGIAFASFAALVFAIGLWITENKLASVGNSVRSAYTMLCVFVIVILIGLAGSVENGFALPATKDGWVGLTLLAILYSTGFSCLFLLFNKLNMARNAPVANFEPVASLFIAYWVLGQVLSPMQLLGGGIVMTGIVLVSVSKNHT